MKKNWKKFFKYLPFLSYASPLLFLSVAPNQNQESNKNQELEAKKQKSDQVAQWNLFLQQNYIQTLLRMSFTDETKMQEYVKSQIDLGEEYYKNIKMWLRYANTISTPFDRDLLSFFGNAKHNFVTTEGKKYIQEMMNKNWLSFLFHFNKMKFIQFNTLQADKIVLDDVVENVETNKLIAKEFYIPTNNNILDYVIQFYDQEKNFNDETNETEISYEKRVFLLTEDGFILRFDIRGNETLSLIKSVEFHPYIYSYPKLLQSKDKLNDFDLKKYLSTFAEWASENIKYSDANRALFADRYGEQSLRYTIIDIEI
ncbi:aromatic motif membrane protein [Mycoplasma leonicaptivi]|uniref:aromatic motif membrane protein n=1 Tax=Mycoplasma leonicaptivi TaxID=36742 RepID=UPI000487584D|nr:aromatic motif membrane protein [Mycoplasma leonicaptivi]